MKAAEMYLGAVAMASGEIGSHETTWVQARRLMDKLGAMDGERALVQTAFAHLAKAR